MSQIYQDENRQYQFDFSSALWATDRLHDIYSQNKAGILSDVDFIAETEDGVLLVEYKNAKLPGAARPEAFIQPIKSARIKSLSSITTAGCIFPPCRRPSP